MGRNFDCIKHLVVEKKSIVMKVMVVLVKTKSSVHGLLQRFKKIL